MSIYVNEGGHKVHMFPPPLDFLLPSARAHGEQHFAF